MEQKHENAWREREGREECREAQTQICKEMYIPTEQMAPELRGTLLAPANMSSLKSKSDPCLEFSLGCDSHRSYFKCLVWELMTLFPLHLAYLSRLFSHLSSTLNPALLGMNLHLSLLQVCKNARLFQSNLLLFGFISVYPSSLHSFSGKLLLIL